MEWTENNWAKGKETAVCIFGTKFVGSQAAFVFLQSSHKINQDKTIKKDR